MELFLGWNRQIVRIRCLRDSCGQSKRVGRYVKPKACVVAFVLFVAANTACAESVPVDLVGEILRRIPEWPGTQVEIPLKVYDEWVREMAAGPVLPKPPDAAWVERAAWTVRVSETGFEVAPVFEVICLPGAPPPALRVLPDCMVWRDVTLDDRPLNLRRQKDGWFYFDPAAPGRYRLAAKASVKPRPFPGGYHVGFTAPKAALTTASVESDGAWEVAFRGAAFPIVGDEKGTRGTVGLAPTDEMDVTWRRPQPPVHRAAQIESTSQVGWTLAEGAHQVRAILDLRLWGGEAEQLTLNLPPGADRVIVTGPDVREVQVQGGEVRVFLRGAIVQRTRLNVSFDVPRPPTGRMTLPAFGVAGAGNRGGTLAIAGGAGGVLLELDSPGLTAVAIRDLADEVRGLLSAPAIYAYTLAAGAWEARADLVGMTEFPVRETLADSALYTVLYRPDGRLMVKVIFEVRNRAQQYMRVELPPGAQLMVARVAEEQRNLARGPDGSVYVPLEKSVLTTAGLVSFPVEVVYVMPGPALGRQGKVRLPLPRIDLPIAYARCALMLPDGMKVRQWEGVLRQVGAWSSETAEIEFEYGRGHALLPPKEPVQPPAPAEAPRPKQPGLFEAVGGLFGIGTSARAPERPEPAPPQPQGEVDERLKIQQQTLHAKNFYRAGVDFYGRGNYEKAHEFFNKVVEIAPNSSEADNAKKYLGNTAVALGWAAGGAKEDRSSRAAAKAVQMTQQAGNVQIIEQQQELLQQAEQSLKAGDQAKAEAAYKVAVNIAGKLQARGEAAKEQEATVRKAREFLEQRERSREQETRKLGDLQKEVQSLKRTIAEKGGKEAAQVVDALVATDTPVVAADRAYTSVYTGGTRIVGRPEQPARPVPSAEPTQPQAPPVQPSPAPQAQIDVGGAIAEQQAARDLPVGGRGGQGGAGGAAYHRYAQPQAADRLDVLQKQVEQLKAIQKDLHADVNGDIRADKKQVWEDEGKLSSSSLGRQVAEKAKTLGAQAKEAEELARQGRVVEAARLVESLEKETEVAGRAAQALTKAGAGAVAMREGVVAGKATLDFDVAAGAVAKVPPPAGPEPAAVAGRPAAPPQARPTLMPDQIAAHFHAAMPSPDEARTASSELRDVAEARRKLAQAKEAVAAKARELDKVKINVGDLTQGGADGKKLAEFVASNYSWALQTGSGQVTAGLPAGRPGTGPGNVTAAGQATPPGAMNLNTMVNAGTLSLGGGTVTLYNGQSVTVNAPVAVQVGDGSNLVVLNDPNALRRVEAVLERLRVNAGQRVAVGSRNLFVAGDAALAAGIQWSEGANGARYAVVNEGQLRALMDVEQRSPNTALPPLPRDVRQEAVVGTEAIVANGAVVNIAHAGDDKNTLDYIGNTLQVSHDDYLVVNNGGYVTAIKSGRMQHWAAEVEPVRFPGVPAAVVVPAVGYTVKFEKTLLDPSDSLELVADYTWQGEQR